MELGDKLLTTLVSVISAIIVVAIIALLVSRQSQTAQVLQAGGNAFSGILNSAFGAANVSGVGIHFTTPGLTIGF